MGEEPSGSPCVKIVIDASSDGRRAAFVALIVVDGKKPRLIYGTGESVSFRDVEAWGIKRALRRVNIEHDGSRPIIVFTDAQRLVLERLGGHVKYCWLPRKNPLMQNLHRAANALRKSLPVGG
ncbi:MAG: hypothetical protein FD119_2824 [Stygiobacter sp.]|nr:MAG: hypothetical protein FD119_2824 [Stygiobacter sp.]